MEKLGQTWHTRRAILKSWLTMLAASAVAACTGQQADRVTPQAVGQAQPTGVPPTQVPPTPIGTPPPLAPPTPAATVPTAVAATLPTQITPIAPAPTQAAQAPALTPTPECGDDDDDVTPAQTEGPYYTPNTPERVSLLDPGIVGTKLVVTGAVLSTGCRPVARALLDFWQCDDKGVYDNRGYTLRGHQFADDQGRFRLETIVPGLYPGRTRHIHVKVQAPNGPILTTQLYFPGEPRNRTDGIFSQELVLALQDAADGKVAAFNFVLNIG